MSIGTLYDTFNARFMSPREVAQTFVPNADFTQLCENCHSILMGPRGSGKTTLFKMLTPEALHNWNDPDAMNICASMPFVAIYIPSDIHWDRQLTDLSHELQDFPRLEKQASLTAVTTNVLTSTCETFIFLLKQFEFRHSENEVLLSQYLIKEWKLPPTLPDLDAIYCGLQSRMSDIIVKIQIVLAGCKGDNDALIQLPDYFRLDYLFATHVACTIFERLFPKIPIRRWALCFDELELTPKWLHNRLFAELRSTTPHFLFKLSTSPIPPVIDERINATPRDDVTIIRLWRYGPQSVREFADRLTRAILKRRGFSNPDPFVIFGHSDFAADIHNGSTVREYDKGSRVWRIIREEAKKDPSLFRLLESRGVDPDNPTTENETTRDQVLRKIKPTVLLRNAFRKVNRNDRTLGRSRKVVSLFSGTEIIYDMTDGNPRWLIGILNDLLSYCKKNNKDKIPKSEQASILKNVSATYSALVRTFPSPVVTIDGRQFHICDILKFVGTYFRDRNLNGDFPLDPVGSFIVDSATQDQMLELLRIATYYGALVYVDPQANTFDISVKNKRFRLTFLLSPFWSLPLRLNKPVSLSQCLNHFRKRPNKSYRSKKMKHRYNGPMLFGV